MLPPVRWALCAADYVDKCTRVAALREMAVAIRMPLEDDNMYHMIAHTTDVHQRDISRPSNLPCSQVLMDKHTNQNPIEPKRHVQLRLGLFTGRCRTKKTPVSDKPTADLGRHPPQ